MKNIVLVLLLIFTKTALAEKASCETPMERLLFSSGKLQLAEVHRPFSTMQNRADHLTELGKLTHGTSVLANVREIQKLYWTNTGDSKNPLLISHLNMTYLDVDFFIGASQFLGGRPLGTFSTVNLRFKEQVSFDQNLSELKTSVKTRKLNTTLSVDNASRTIIIESLDLSQAEQQKFLGYLAGKYVAKQVLDSQE